MKTHPRNSYPLKSKVRVVSSTTLILIGLLSFGQWSSAQTQNSNSNANSNTNQQSNTNTSSGSGGTTNANANAARPTSVPQCPSAESYQQIVVTKAYKKDMENEVNVRLEDEITLEIQNLKTLLDRARCQVPAKKIVLFLDQRPVKDATPFPPTDPNRPSLVFPLKRTEDSRDVWTYILGEAKWSPREVNVSVGIEDEYAVESLAKLKLKAIPAGWFLLWAIILLVIIAVFGVLAHKSDLLRDSGPQPVGARKPYSLARTQAAWWFFLILASYLFIGIITGDFSTTITTSVLSLLGISAGTVVGSAFVDAGKTAAVASPPGPPSVNEYWWVDILSDANGVSFHRFQIAVWSLVLGIIFVVAVYQSLAMPTFGGTLLSLMGISAGTYLGLKIPEPK